MYLKKINPDKELEAFLINVYDTLYDQDEYMYAELIVDIIKLYDEEKFKQIALKAFKDIAKLDYDYTIKENLTTLMKPKDNETVIKILLDYVNKVSEYPPEVISDLFDVAQKLETNLDNIRICDNYAEDSEFESIKELLLSLSDEQPELYEKSGINYQIYKEGKFAIGTQDFESGIVLILDIKHLKKIINYDN